METHSINTQPEGLTAPLLPAEDEGVGIDSSREVVEDDEEEQLILEGSADNATQVDDQLEERESPWMRSLFRFKKISIGSVILVEQESICGFCKFTLFTVLLLIAVHVLIRKLDWEHDANNTLEAILSYQSSLLWLDLVVFFVVARAPQVDTVAWMLVSSTAAVFTSWISRFKFLQHSATLFEIHCTWTWQTWGYALGVFVVCIVLVILHIRHAWKQQRIASKSIEIIVTALAFFGPALALTPSDFHLHHWLAGWWLGMHCNFATSWSQLCMAWCWGLYVNGIAVYGRDPMQVCGYIDYYSQDQHCHALDSMLQTDNAVDWRNCSASGYHP